ncbi:MAG: cell wall-binding repeat-containing protein [Bradymonadaceae bacterium]|nr:cell wall-binding repeat-containing protein [Lujinxingiaceae bacterium]
MNDEAPVDDFERIAVELWIAHDAIEILAVHARVPPSRPAANGPAELRYEVRDARADLVEAGTFADPRVVHSEFDRAGNVSPVVETAGAGSTWLFLPDIDGTVKIDDASTTLGILDLVRDLQTHTVPLLQPDDILGAPVKLLDNGASAQRADILFVPDGFTEAQMERFHEDVNEILEGLKRDPDYAAVWRGFNFWRQDVRSRDAGINESGQVRNTAFDVGPLGDSGRCHWPSNDGARAIRDLGATVNADYVVVIINTALHSGCATSSMTTVSITPNTAHVLAHELGHGLFNLGDEYAYAGVAAGSCASERPNIATSAARASLPWRDLLTTNTLPTPDRAEFHRFVGAFEGAGYCETGRFRPHHDCMMRSLGQPFCPVCRHARDRYFAPLGVEPEQPQIPANNKHCDHVSRVAGSNRFATAANLSRELFADGAQVVVLANGSDISPDALAAGPLAFKFKAPLLLTARDGLPIHTEDEIHRLGATRVIIVGGESVVGPGVARQLQDARITVERIFGANRFETAALIARRLTSDKPSTLAFIASGENTSLVDALAAGGPAAALGAPILLTSRDALPAATAQAIRDLGITRTIVVGGSGAVSEAVFAQLPGATRLSGPDRYQTAVAIATHAMEQDVVERSTMFLAQGIRLPDALAAAAAGRILLLTQPTTLNTHAAGFLEKHAINVTIMGGEAAVGDAVERAVCTAVQ